MKAVIVLLGLGGCALFLIMGGCGGVFTGSYTSTDSNGLVHTHCWAGCKSSISDNAGATIPDSPAVKDALAIMTAVSSKKIDQALTTLNATVARQGYEPSGVTATLVRREFPRVAATIRSEAPGARDRLLAVDLRTTAGQACRVAELDHMARVQSLFDSASHDLAAGRKPATVVHTFVTRAIAANRAFMRMLKPCLEQLQPADRGGVKYVMGTG